jgi:hypothetical protein
MKTSIIASLLTLAAACSVESPTAPPVVANGGSGGTSGSGGGAGTSGAAGTATGGGGSGGGSAGSTSGGTSGAGGTSGTSGTGGGGSGGSGGTSGGGPTIEELVGDLDGYLFTAPCGDAGTGYDCLNAGCTDGQKDTVVEFPIAGDPATTYDVTVHVWGIVEAKNYDGGTRRAGDTMDASSTGGDFWYEGGTIPFSSYNTYELHVTPPVYDAANDYFLNARNGSGENHESWALNYTATFPVKGGGTITYRVYDSNCRQIMNCGPGTGSSSCAAPRSLNISAAEPQPADFTQPYVGPAPGGALGQWLLIDVTSVEPR